MLICKEVQDSLSARMDAELAPALLERVETHLVACAACREVAHDLEDLDRFLLDAPPLPGVPELPTRLCEELFPPVGPQEGRPAPAARVVPLPLPARPPAPVAHQTLRFAALAALVLGAVGLLVVRDRSSEAVRPLPSPAVKIARPTAPTRRAPFAEAAFARRWREEMARTRKELGMLKGELEAFKASAAAESLRSDQAIVSRRMETWK